MHGDVAAPVQQRILKLFRKRALAAKLGRRSRNVAVAGSANLNSLNGNIGMNSSKLRSHPARLSKRKLRSTPTNEEGVGHRQSSGQRSGGFGFGVSAFGEVLNRRYPKPEPRNPNPHQ